jgi:glycosyltransferase involved in cell wall biosynthesis
MPLVSVIIPAYNAERYLAEALDSVAAQGYRPLEVIVVDDGSTDGTAGLAARFPNVRYMYQANRGPAAARNAGLALAQGEMVAFLDADDVWSDDKLQVQLGLLADDPRAGFILGQTQLVRQVEDAALPASPLGEPGLIISLASALFRRYVFERVGLLDETLRFSEDTDWFLRAWELRIPMIIHPQTVLLYRRHSQNLTGDREMANKMLVTALKRSLDRRRKQRQGEAGPLPGLTSRDKP